MHQFICIRQFQIEGPHLDRANMFASVYKIANLVGNITKSVDCDRKADQCINSHWMTTSFQN